MSEGTTGGTARARTSRTKMTLRVLVSLLLIAVIFWYLLKDISLAAVWAAITAMTWGELAAWPGRRLEPLHLRLRVDDGHARPVVRAGHDHDPGDDRHHQHRPRRLGHRHRHDLRDAAQLGFSRSRTTIAVLVSGVWNAFAKLAIPVLALALVALQGNAGRGRITAAVSASAAGRRPSWCSPR